MSTIIKLKAEIDNPNLPVLMENGEIGNYYVGRWFNKCVELGYTPTETELNAIKAFIQNGVSNDWLDFIKYYLPFIGSKDNYMAGAVPLIDKVGNYEMAEYEGGFGSYTLEKAFAYDANDKIVSLGYSTNDAVGGSAFIKTPIQMSDMHNGVSAFFNFKPIDGILGDLASITDNSQTKGFDLYILANNTLQFTVTGVSGSLTIGVLNKNAVTTAISNNQNINLGLGIYSQNSVGKYNSFAYTTGTHAEYANSDWSSINNMETFSGKLNIKGPTAVRTNKIPLYSFGVFDISKNSRARARAFSDAVFALNTALGRS